MSIMPESTTKYTVVALFGAMFLSFLLIASFLAIKPKPHTPEQLFVIDMRDRCRAAANADGHYDSNGGLFECWRKPFMRHPKKVFTEKFNPRSIR